MSIEVKIQVGGGLRSKNILGLSSIGVGIREKAYGPASGGRINWGKTTAGPLSTGMADEPRGGIGLFTGLFSAFCRPLKPLHSHSHTISFTKYKIQT